MLLLFCGGEELKDVIKWQNLRREDIIILYVANIFLNFTRKFLLLLWRGNSDVLSDSEVEGNDPMRRRTITACLIFGVTNSPGAGSCHN